VGQDAADFINLTKTLSDEKIDGLFSRLYSGEADLFVGQ